MNARITVLMPVHNAAPFVADAIRSILHQTFAHFELVIVDDHSDDESMTRVAEFNDARIVRLSNMGPRGVAHALNVGLQAARAKYVARMDADDISLPNRLQRQFDFLEAHSHIDIVGTHIAILETSGKVRKDLALRPRLPGHTRWSLLFYCALAHPTVMARRSVLVGLGGYDERFVPAEDYELWLRAVQAGNAIANLDEILLHYRMNPQGISVSAAEEQEETALQLSKQALENAMPVLAPIDRAVLRMIKNPDSLPRRTVSSAMDRAIEILESSTVIMREAGTTEAEMNAIVDDAGFLARRLVWNSVRRSPSLLLERPQSSLTTRAGLLQYLLSAVTRRLRARTVN